MAGLLWLKVQNSEFVCLFVCCVVCLSDKGFSALVDDSELGFYLFVYLSVCLSVRERF